VKRETRICLLPIAKSKWRARKSIAGPVLVNKAMKDHQDCVFPNAGVQNLTFDAGHPVHAARYQEQSLERMALYIQGNYMNGSSLGCAFLQDSLEFLQECRSCKYF
jgi:hypothetical protein